MALSFLSNALGTLGKGLGVVNQYAGPLQSILGAVQGIKNSKDQRKYENRILDMSINRPPSPAEAYSISMQKALADPNNSLVKQLQGEEYQMLMNAINQGIQGKVLSDRREAALGRRPTFFDPERADENISYQLSRGAPAAALQARTNVMDRILQAARGVGSFSGEQSGRYQSSLNAMGTDYLRRYGEGSQPQTNTVQKILKTIQDLSASLGRTGGIAGPVMTNPNIRGTQYLMR
jgi:hypothetical protein